MKRVLLTGADGFIGSHCVEHFLATTDWQIVCLSSWNHGGFTERMVESHLFEHRGRVEIHTHDLVADLSPLLIKKLGAIDAIVHFAAESHVDTSIAEPRMVIENNVKVTLTVLEAARKLRPEIVIQVSSVVGDTPVMVRRGGEILRTQFDEWWAVEELRSSLRGDLPSDRLRLDNVEVLNLNQGRAEFSRATWLIRHKLSKRLRKVSYTGGELTVTDDHSLFVFDENGEIREVPSNEIEEGDLLVTLSSGVPVRSPANFNLWSMLSPASVDHLSAVVGNRVPEARFKYYNLKKIQLNDPYVLEFLGVFLADGCAWRGATAQVESQVSAVRIVLHNERKLIHRAFVEGFCLAYGYDFRVSEHGDEAIAIDISSTELNLLFRDLFSHGGRNKRLCGSWAWKLDTNQVWRLFAGYSADAHKIKAGGLRFTTASRDLAIDVCWLLRLHGISCIINHQTAEDIAGRKTPMIDGREIHSGPYWMLTIPKGDIPGAVLSECHRTPFNRCLPSSFVRAQIDVLPSGELRQALRKRGVAKAKLARYLPEGLRKKVLDNDLAYTSVSAVEDLGVVDQWVYDASCGEAGESFLAGFSPVLCHNTDEVYGPAIDGVGHPEWSPILPSNPYSSSKASQEATAICYWRTYGVPVVLVNAMNCVGERQHPEKFLPMVIRNVLRGDVVHIHSSGADVGSRNYLHARTYCDACRWLVERADPWTGVGVTQFQTGDRKPPFGARPDRWNVPGQKRLTNLEFAERVAKVIGKPLKHRLADGNLSRPGHDLHYGLDGTKIERAGWKPPMDFDASLEKTVKWYLNNQAWLELP